AIELEQYICTEVHFGYPVLDLGCGNGTFSAMLREKGLLDSVEVALDYSRKDLPSVNKNVVYGVSQGDARALPFRTGAFASVLANASILHLVKLTGSNSSHSGFFVCLAF